MTSPVWHPFTQHGLDEDIVEISRSEGASLFTSDGREILDAISSWWVTTHGHSHPRIMGAIRAAAEALDQIIFAGFSHEPAELLAHELLAIVPSALRHVFYTDSGSTSVEVALKMALGYWRNLGQSRHRLLVMEHSYHGDTIGAMSVGARGVFNQSYAPLLFEVDRIPFPEAGREQDTIDALDKACRAEPRPAALIVEPLILGAGGMLVYDPRTLRHLREICTRYGVLFIADEIMTGWGRTGSLFAIDQCEIAPDIMCLSKGLTGGAVPLAVTLATPEIFEAHCSRYPARQFFHSSSYTANPIACAAARANLAIWREEPVMDRVQTLAAAQTARLAGLKGGRMHRQIGTITAFEIGGGARDYLANLGPKLRAFCIDRDVLLRPLGNTLYVMPPYCTSADQLDRIYVVIAEVLETFGAD